MLFNNELYILTEKFYSKRNNSSHINENESLAKQVGWQSYETQKQNFEVATNLENISWKSIKSVLDVGCGHGELIRYLREEKGFEGTYTGIDILERFIDVANQVHDDRNIFICEDILSSSKLLSSYDIVMSIGTLSVNYDYPLPYSKKTKYFTENLIELICSVAKLSVALYFIDEEKTTFTERAVAGNMAFYSSSGVCDLLSRQSRIYKKLTLESYPTVKSAKTIAKIYYV
jgi:SAM-dependent methyltransferase